MLDSSTMDKLGDEKKKYEFSYGMLYSVKNAKVIVELRIIKFIVEIHYELTNIQYIYRKYVNIYAFCKHNKAIVLIHYDCIRDEYIIVDIYFIKEL